MSRGKSFFDYSMDEKQTILRNAARRSNEMQNEVMHMSQPKRKDGKPDMRYTINTIQKSFDEVMSLPEIKRRLKK